MNFKFITNLNLNKSDIPYLSFLIIISSLIFLYILNFNENLGIYCSDVFVYLLNSLNFAGTNLNATNTMFLSPIICFLTSILFRLGLVNESAIFIITGLFGIIGNIGMYVLLKNRFNSLFSLTGAILFGTFSLNLVWLANGTLDIPAIALSIWVFIFVIIAIDKNPKYYVLALPLLVIAFFTRYTVGFILPLIFLYYLGSHDIFKFLYDLKNGDKQLKKEVITYLTSYEFKYLILGIGISIAFMIIIIGVILHYNSPLSFLGQTSQAVSGSKGSLSDNAYTSDTWFYLHDFLNFLFAGKISFLHHTPYLSNPSPLAYLIFIILVVGLCGLAIRSYKLFKEKLAEKNSYFLVVDLKYLVILFILSGFIALFGFKFSAMITIVFFLVCIVLAMSILKNYGFNNEEYKLNFMFLSWFVIYFVFFTFMNVKVNRYIITALPAFVYFVILALRFICSKIQTKDYKLHTSKNNFKLANLIPIFLIFIFLISAFSFSGIVHENVDYKSPKIMADYLIQHDSDYKDKKIAVYNKRSYTWFLKTNVIAMPKDKMSFLDSSNIDYYISDSEKNLTNYTVIHKENDLCLYKRI